MKKPHVIALCVLIILLGMLWPLWELSLAGVLLAALTGEWFAALVLGLLLDLLFGAPTGFLRVVQFPFALAALAAVAARAAVVGRLRPVPKNTL